MIFKNNKAQILVITLLVLSVLALTIMGLIIIINRDVFQVTQNQKYEQVYNVAENILLEYLAEYGSSGANIENLLSNPDCVKVENKYECIVLVSGFGIVDAEVEIEIEEVNEFTDLELLKDQAFSLDLSGYQEGLEFSWTPDAALEFMFIYSSPTQDQIPEYKVITDIFNGSGALISPAPPINLLSHKFQFTQTQGNSVEFQISTITGFNPAIDTAVALVVTPRTNVEKINFSVVPETTGLPPQVRIFEATAYDPLDIESPVARVQSYTSLFPQIEGIWNYSLITQGTVN